MVKISIIIPVYNVEKLLPKCLDSILGQSFADFEVILVNDGSRDGSGRVCDEYAARDSRISVIHKSNGGVSSARNRGIDEAQGEYICFIDSDDWVDESFLSGFGIDKQSADLYISGALYDIDDKVYSRKTYEAAYVNGAEAIGVEFSRQGMWSNGYPWGKLYRRDIIHKRNLRFNDRLSIHEDHLFLFEYQTYITSVCITNTAGYHYFVVDHSNRKLSDRVGDYDELLMASDEFDNLLFRMRYHFQLNNTIFGNLRSLYVYGCRQRALSGLFAYRCDDSYLKFGVEVDYWRAVAKRAEMKRRGFYGLVIGLMVNVRLRMLSYIVVGALFKIRDKRPHNAMALIKRDLASRSTIIEQE